MTSDRRRTARIVTDLPVRWKRGRRIVKTSIRDVNADGVLLLTGEDFPTNYVMDLEVDLPDGTVSMMAVSRDLHENGIGAEILAMDSTERARWLEFWRAGQPTTRISTRRERGPSNSQK